MCEVLLKITFLEIGVSISVLMCTIRTRLCVLLIAKIIGRCMSVVSEIQYIYIYIYCAGVRKPTVITDQRAAGLEDQGEIGMTVCECICAARLLWLSADNVTEKCVMCTDAVSC
jgi:hypothetical protein